MTIGDLMQLYVLAAIGISTLVIALFNAVHIKRGLMDATHDLLQLWAGGIVLLFALEAI